MTIFIPLFIAFATSLASASSVLFIGDSHSVGPFGRALDQHLRDEGHVVTTAASCGSIARWWFTGQKTTCGFFARTDAGIASEGTTAPTPLLSELISKTKPELVIIELGGNYVNTPSDDFVRSDISKLVSAVTESGAKCFWITQPDSRKYPDRHHRILKLIQDSTGNQCSIFNSQLVTKYPETGGDGVHYWSPTATPIAKAWALKAFEAIKDFWP